LNENYKPPWKEKVGFFVVWMGFKLLPPPLEDAFSKIMIGFAQAVEQAEIMQCDQQVTLTLCATPPVEAEEVVDDRQDS
jgi:hypothetical protein|tara:strand:- start:332 stop:568 length:237 start_codon:yes stop_codon:yes gene_type:complete